MKIRKFGESSAKEIDGDYKRHPSENMLEEGRESVIERNRASYIGYIGDDFGYYMKHIKSYRIFEANIYDSDWKKMLPNRMTVLKDGKHSFKLGNIMKNPDMVQVTYENEKSEWGIPSTLEFDFYFSKNGHMRIDIDITWGDAMACEFYVESPSNLGITEYTSYHSKMDPSNTVFALEDESLQQLIEFINKFEGFELRRDQFNFLDKYDNYLPN